MTSYLTDARIRSLALMSIFLPAFMLVARWTGAQALPDCKSLDMAFMETNVWGTVTNDYQATWNNDESYESIKEVKPNATSCTLDHRWQFIVTGEPPYRFYLKGYQFLPIDNDHFVFSYSLDNLNYTPMFEVTKTVAEPFYHTYDLPYSGVKLGDYVYVKVCDALPTSGAVTHGIKIDHMFIGCVPPNLPWMISFDFTNQLYLGDLPAEQTQDLAFLSGGGAGTTAAPLGQSANYQLIEDSFGESLPTHEPYEGFVEDTILAAQELVYWEVASSEQKDVAAFRYKVFLYGSATKSDIFDTTEGQRVYTRLLEAGRIPLRAGVETIRANYENMSDWYGDAERARVRTALDLLKTAVKYAPLNLKLLNAYLDIYYDKAVAEVQFVKYERAKLDEYRLGFQLPPAGKFIADVEIEQWQKIVGMYESAFKEYADLFEDTGGVDIQALDPTAPQGATLGWYVFKRLQPIRNQYAAKFIDPSDGLLKTVPDYDPVTQTMTVSLTDVVLFGGYKDFVTLLTMMRDYCMAASELTKLYGMRGAKTATQDDITSANEMIARVQQEVHVDTLLLQGMFPDFNPPPGDASGVNAAKYGLQAGLAALTDARNFLAGKTNVLGFDPRFLVLMQKYHDVISGDQFDSYDAMLGWIRSSPTAPLPYADAKYEEAKDNYFLYRGYADQVYNEARDISASIADRYFEITGFDPPDPFIMIPPDNLTHPKPGCELDKTNASIQQGLTRFSILNTMSTQIQSDIGAKTNFMNSCDTTLKNNIDSNLLTYLTQRATQYDTMSDWAAAAAGMAAGYTAISDVCSIDAGIEGTNLIGSVIDMAIVTAAGIANVGIQTQAAIENYNAQKELDKSAASYEAQNAKIELDMTKQQTQFEINDLQREAISNKLDMSEAGFTQAQDVSQRAALLRELERLQNWSVEVMSGLANRYYADPVHKERSQNSLILADEAFRAAQKWAFMLARALEFKWNKPFLIDYLGKSWETSSLFKLRNAKELDDYIAAIVQFNNINLIGFNRESYVDRISLRDDILAPWAGTGTDTGLRVDTATSQVVTPGELLRRKLSRMQNAYGDLSISLNTFSLKKNSGVFFVGVKYHNDGSISQLGKSIDKIEWIKINVVTTQTPGTQLADLSYGGVCYLRTRTAPCFDVASPTEYKGEYQVFPFRYYRTLDSGLTWDSLAYQRDTVKMALSPTSGEPDAGVPNSTYENTFLKERSVAATDWIMQITNGTLDVNQLSDIEIYVKHNFITREMPICN
ncbi:MAG: hypothetical protein NTX50_01775 [Candidatus Sumerlaeota bacterium]|nr:hypothetical protein [Candidatus Sumerlaeota bacterium]